MLLSATTKLYGCDWMYRRFSRVASLEKPDTQGWIIFTSPSSRCIVHPFQSFYFGRFSYVQRYQYEHTSQHAIHPRFYYFIPSTTHSFPFTHHTLDQPLRLPHPKHSSFKPLETNVPTTPRPTPHKALTDIPPTSSDTFPIPDTDLVLHFDVFGPLLNIADVNELLTLAEADIQAQINRHGADALISYEGYGPWRTADIALDVYESVIEADLTLGEFHSLIGGLGLYMVRGRRSREAKFRMTRVREASYPDLAGGDLWLIRLS